MKRGQCSRGKELGGGRSCPLAKKEGPREKKSRGGVVAGLRWAMGGGGGGEKEKCRYVSAIYDLNSAKGGEGGALCAGDVPRDVCVCVEIFYTLRPISISSARGRQTRIGEEDHEARRHAGCTLRVRVRYGRK